MATPWFTSREIQQIEQTVRTAEEMSGSEIVPVFTKQASFYESALWRAAAAGMFAAGLALTLLYVFTDSLLFYPPWLWLLILFSGACLSAAVVQAIPPLKRKLAGRKTMARRTLDQAKNMFHDSQVSHTEQRTGILLFISFFERQAVILADVGISELVEEASWQQVIQDLTTGLQQRQISGSICQAIMACGRIVEASGVQKTAPDGNELSDQIKFTP